MTSYRTEHDSLGPVRVPADAYYGAQTQRAVENFPISGLRIERALIRALAAIKGAAALENGRLKVIPKDVAAAIHEAADEVMEPVLRSAGLELQELRDMMVETARRIEDRGRRIAWTKQAEPE